MTDEDTSLDRAIAETRAPEAIPLARFLAERPPGSKVLTIAGHVQPPELKLHCPSQFCGGERFFDAEQRPPSNSIKEGEEQAFLMRYMCRHCKQEKKTFAVTVLLTSLSALSKPPLMLVKKFGELPPFGPPTSARLVTMLGSEAETFFKGRRCESQGLGIGAFAYYRRAVENRKNALFDGLIKAARISRASDLVEQLKNAKKETQFKQAVEGIKAGLPPPLLIDGHHDPLKLLHGALSDGLHGRTDEECLQGAQDVRLVLSDLCDRLGGILQDHRELRDAVSRLISDKSKSSGANRSST